MSTTPQIIKDQEFQVKFRGYDPLEVKAYLDTIADEFFELQERCRLQVEDLQAFHEEREDLEQQKLSLEAGSDESRKMAEDLRQTGLRMEQRIAVLTKEMEGLRAFITSLEQEKKTHLEGLAAAGEQVRKAEEEAKRQLEEKKALQRRIEQMEDQQRLAQKDEVDFRSTLAVAQKFCDSMKEKSKQEADALLEKARAEIAAMRREAYAKLSSLPGEIETLQQKREEARRVLRTTLESYLQNLDIFPVGGSEVDVRQENDDLFQKIQILEDGSLSPLDLSELNISADMLAAHEGEQDLLSVFGGDDDTEKP